MEKYTEALMKAKRNLEIAEHMLSVTYPLVKDARLLMPVLENVFLSFTNAMAGILYCERLFKRIPPFHDTFESKYNLFNLNIAPRYGIDRDFLLSMREIKDILMERKKSPVEFVRSDRFVICSHDYSMKAVSFDQMKKYISKARLFVSLADGIVRKNEGIFRRSRAGTEAS